MLLRFKFLLGLALLVLNFSAFAENPLQVLSLAASWPMTQRQTSDSEKTATGPQPKSSLQARLLTSANLAWACLRINRPAAPQIAVGLELPVSTPHHPQIYPAWPCPKGLRC